MIEEDEIVRILDESDQLGNLKGLLNRDESTWSVPGMATPPPPLDDSERLPFYERRVLDLPCLGPRDPTRRATERKAIAEMMQSELEAWLRERDVTVEGDLVRAALEYRGLDRDPDEGPSPAAAKFALARWKRRLAYSCQMCGADGIYEDDEVTECIVCRAPRTQKNPWVNSITRLAERCVPTDDETDDRRHRCAYCLGIPDRPLRCSRCAAAYYCSRDCQKKHWRAAHSAKCRPR